MKSIWVLAQKTIIELYRDRLLYVLVFLGFLLMIMSILFSNLSVQEGLKLTIDFGLSGIHIILQVISIFLGSSLIQKEVDKKTILFVMSYPVQRWQFIVGKIVGFSVIQCLVIIMMGFIFYLILLNFGWSYHFSYFQAILGIYLESLILGSLMISFGGIFKTVTSTLVGTGVFLIGHSLSSFKELSLKNKDHFSIVLSQIFDAIIPNLELFNLRSNVVYQINLSSFEVTRLITYASIWIFIYLIMGTMFFRRKDFV